MYEPLDALYIEKQRKEKLFGGSGGGFHPSVVGEISNDANKVDNRNLMIKNVVEIGVVILTTG